MAFALPQTDLLTSDLEDYTMWEVPENTSILTTDSMVNSQVISSIHSQVALYAAVSLMGIVIVVGCIGNILVIMAVRTTKKLQTVSNAFVVNLSVCDLLFVTVVLPFNIYTYVVDGWYLPHQLCKFVGFLGYTLTGTTIMTITLIAWNRYKLIVDLTSYRRLFVAKRIAVMLGVAWVLPVICLTPALLEVWGHFGYVAMMVTCNLLLDHDSQSFKLFLLIVRAAIPCMLILYFYLSIYSTTKASHRRVRKGRLLSHDRRLDQHIQRKEMHLTKMMATIFLVFALSYFPCTISSIVDWNTVLSKRFHMFCLITVYVGSAVNPLIYGLMNSQFRHAYYKILLCRCRTCSEEKSGCPSLSVTTLPPNRSSQRRKEMVADQQLCNENTYSDPTPQSSPQSRTRKYHVLHRTETEKTYVDSESSKQVGEDDALNE